MFLASCQQVVGPIIGSFVRSRGSFQVRETSRYFSAPAGPENCMKVSLMAAHFLWFLNTSSRGVMTTPVEKFKHDNIFFVYSEATLARNPLARTV
eukprot:XP_001704983.1 Hypothetical protein GL50803_86482 [Giardia lamblia ATCC 50803]